MIIISTGDFFKLPESQYILVHTLYIHFSEVVHQQRCSLVEFLGSHMYTILLSADGDVLISF